MVIDDFYDENEYFKIWQEISFLSNEPDKFESDPSKTGSAINENGTYKKQNKGLFLDVVYSNNRNISNILRENRKIFSMSKELENYHSFYRYITQSNKDATLLNYYESSDYYEPHFDNAIITAVTWFYDKPKKFKGGDLILEKTTEIECIDNRIVIIPSIMSHSVTEISMDAELQNKNLGRYSLAQFIRLV
jgi:Rps23 Pro-64 3,4-dihydroxylase Tpa1-like proline 4-hydroxylase